jgi:hypothetical protein
MKGSTYRAISYNYKVDPITLLSDLTVLLPNMVANFAAVTPQITAMELQVKQVCDTAGVPTISLPFYLCFGREIFAMIRRDISGETAAINVAMQIAKWVGRGLNSAILAGIRTDVFSISAPIGA